MDIGIITVLLPLALAIVMAGLGLELSVEDFLRVRKHPKAVIIALVSQLFILVGIAFLICELLNLPPYLSVGLVLLAASPGGATASLFSFLYKGDVALNITLTAINAILAAITLPFIVNFAISHFIQDTAQIGLQFSKVIQVFAIILIPVAIGMFVRNKWPNFAAKLEKPVRIFAVVFLIAIIAGAVFAERQNITSYLAQVGIATALFCLASLTVGYYLPRLFGVPSFQARACAFEIGIHNSTLSLAIALTILNNTEIAIPSAVYSIFMYIFAALFGVLLNKYAPLDQKKHQDIETV